MGDITVTLPDEVRELIDAQIADGRFANAGDYIAELVKQDQEMRLANLRAIVTDGLASGVSTRTVNDIFAEAVETSRRRGTLRD